MKRLVVLAMVLTASGCATSGQLQEAKDQITLLHQRSHMEQRDINELTQRVKVLEKQEEGTRKSLNAVIQYLNEDDD